MGFKPIFEEERQFLMQQGIVNLPQECWRNGSKIYLDPTCFKPLYEFKVQGGKLNVVKDNSEIIPTSQQKSIFQLISENKSKLLIKFNKSVETTIKMICEYPNHLWIVSHSGGKDSTLVYYVWNEALKQIKSKNISEPNWVINFANTSNETADTYKFIKQLPKDRLRILNPDIGFYQWVINVKKYFTPSTRVRNCCSTYKEGQINKFYDSNKETIMVSGVRALESTKRAEYKTVMDYDWRKQHFGNSSYSNKWILFAPICEEWSDEDVWLFLLMNNISFNKMYRYGFHRVGCLVCPFQQDYIDLLIKHYYPKMWEHWLNILSKSYNAMKVKRNLKWSLEEWQNGRWKRALSKEYFLINNKPTPERVRELSNIKGISENMALKYFQKTCSCGKKCSPTEIAMFYKTQGRFENQEDNRTVLCKKCLCEKNNWTSKQYYELVNDFQESGCNLF